MDSSFTKIAVFGCIVVHNVIALIHSIVVVNGAYPMDSDNIAVLCVSVRLGKLSQSGSHLRFSTPCDSFVLTVEYPAMAFNGMTLKCVSGYSFDVIPENFSAKGR